MSSNLNLSGIQQPSYDTTNLAGRAEASGAKPKSTKDANDLSNKEVFLQLLIAQIKNQDPTKPADSIQYLTQLSQFTGVEQLVDIKQQMKTLIERLTPAAATETKTP